MAGPDAEVVSRLAAIDPAEVLAWGVDRSAWLPVLAQGFCPSPLREGLHWHHVPVARSGSADDGGPEVGAVLARGVESCSVLLFGEGQSEPANVPVSVPGYPCVGSVWRGAATPQRFDPD